MTQASVGFHCPECLKQHGQQVVTARNMGAQPIVTVGLIAVNALMFVITRGSGTRIGDNALARNLGLFGPDIDVNNEWWRIFTSGFLHADVLHIGFNMYLLYMLGQQLEKVFGNVDFALLYLAGLTAGSLGALIVEPRAFTVGASGAVYGLMGAWLMLSRSRGVSFANSGIAGLLIINTVLSFTLPNVAWGGHAGGFVGGLAVGWILTDGRQVIANLWARRGLAVAVSVFSCAASLWAATTWSNPLLG